VDIFRGKLFGPKNTKTVGYKGACFINKTKASAPGREPTAAVSWSRHWAQDHQAPTGMDSVKEALKKGLKARHAAAFRIRALQRQRRLVFLDPNGCARSHSQRRWLLVPGIAHGLLLLPAHPHKKYGPAVGAVSICARPAPPPRPPHPPAPHRHGRTLLVVGKQLGEGGYATVWRVIEREPDGKTRDLAVKRVVFDPTDADALAAIKSEIETMAALPPHPNILRLIGHCRRLRPRGGGEEAYMLLELCGDSLAWHLQRRAGPAGGQGSPTLRRGSALATGAGKLASRPPATLP